MTKIEKIKKQLHKLGAETISEMRKQVSDTNLEKLNIRYETLLEVLNDVCAIDNNALEFMEDEDE